MWYGWFRETVVMPYAVPFSFLVAGERCLWHRINSWVFDRNCCVLRCTYEHFIFTFRWGKLESGHVHDFDSINFGLESCWLVRGRSLGITLLGNAMESST